MKSDFFENYLRLHQVWSEIKFRIDRLPPHSARNLGHQQLTTGQPGSPDEEPSLARLALVDRELDRGRGV